MGMKAAVNARCQLAGRVLAAGLKPLIATPAAESGLAVLVSGIAFVVLGYPVSGNLWWMPGAMLILFGLIFMLWPLVLRRLVGRQSADPDSV